MTPPRSPGEGRDPAPRLPRPLLRRLVADALEEDLPGGDLTTDLLVPAGTDATGRVVARDDGVVAGLPLADSVCGTCDPELSLSHRIRDGRDVDAGDVICTIDGPARSILHVERTVLNFLQRLSGIATLAARFVDAVEGTGARIVDTRKTTPGWRALEKYAVRCGGARNHRFGLSDGFLLKDNHRAVLRSTGRTLSGAVEEARRRLPHTVPVEIEVDDLDQLDEALSAGADVVLLDNFGLDELRTAVERTAGRALLEASGGIDLETVGAVAETGVDLVSVGALTHSAPALDLALDLHVA